jgi:hypothetical protein
MEQQMMQGQNMQPQAQPDMGQNNGPQPVEDIGFNQDVQNVLLSRVQSISEQEMLTLRLIVNEQTYGVLLKLFPELEFLLQMAMEDDEEQVVGQQMPQQPQGGGMPGAGAPQMRNPILNDSVVSRGLMR